MLISSPPFPEISESQQRICYCNAQNCSFSFYLHTAFDFTSFHTTNESPMRQSSCVLQHKSLMLLNLHAHKVIFLYVFLLLPLMYPSTHVIPFLLFKRVLNKIPSNPYTPSTSHVKLLTQPIISPLIEVNINVHNYWFVTVIYRVLPSNTGL